MNLPKIDLCEKEMISYSWCCFSSLIFCIDKLLLVIFNQVFFALVMMWMCVMPFFEKFTISWCLLLSHHIHVFIFGACGDVINVFKNKLFTKVNARTNGRCHETGNLLNKKTQPPLMVSLLSVWTFFPSECPGPCQPVQTDRSKLSEVAGSFYAPVFMAPSICSSVDFCK